MTSLATGKHTFRLRKEVLAIMEFKDDLRQKGFKVRRYRNRRLKTYCEQMSKDNGTVLFDDNVARVLQEQGYFCEVAPRSIYSVEKLYGSLAAYAPGKAVKPKPGPALDHGIALAYACFARPKEAAPLQALPFTPETIDLVTSKKSASAGLTAYGCTKGESMARALERGLDTMLGKKAPEPCLAFKRTQFNGKTRLVWGYPYSMTAIEGLVAKPLIDLFKGRDSCMTFATTTLSIGSRLRASSRCNKYAYSLDYSQFDASVSAELIHIAFKILKSWYDQDQVEPVSGLTVREIFKMIEHYFIHTTIVMPDGNLYLGKDHGVPSGSYFTQMVDSVVNCIAAGCMSHAFKLHVDKHHLFILGDDCMFWSNSLVSLDQLAAYVDRNLGLHLHGSEKSEVTRFDEPVHFLGRTWTEGVPDLDLEGIIERMVYPESFRKYPSEPEARQRAVRILILSYAANYRSAWSVAQDCLLGKHTNARHIRNGELGAMGAAYWTPTGEIPELNENAVSGLIRFQMTHLNLYRKHSRWDWPSVAMQFLL